MDPCRLCETRKPRRWCPGVRGEICALCCGAERESTVDCPLDCEFLLEARRHEKPLAFPSGNDFPNRDVEVTEAFLARNRDLTVLVAQGVLGAAVNTPGAVDSDVREALAALIKTYRTLQSGLIYQTRPANPYAEALRQGIQAAIEQAKASIHEAAGLATILDANVLGVLVFLERLALVHNNGRRRGRSFVSLLDGEFPRAADRTA